jgi:thymidylate synthase
MMVAQEVNMVPEEFVWTGGDVHLYDNHKEQVEELLTREPKPLPTVKLNPEVKSVFDFTYDDIELIGYDPHPPIKAPVAV